MMTDTMHYLPGEVRKTRYKKQKAKLMISHMNEVVSYSDYWKDKHST
jgi:hypothetical protein